MNIFYEHDSVLLCGSLLNLTQKNSVVSVDFSPNTTTPSAWLGWCNGPSLSQINGLVRLFSFIWAEVDSLPLGSLLACLLEWGDPRNFELVVFATRFTVVDSVHLLMEWSSLAINSEISHHTLFRIGVKTINQDKYFTLTNELLNVSLIL